MPNPVLPEPGTSPIRMTWVYVVTLLVLGMAAGVLLGSQMNCASTGALKRTSSSPSATEASGTSSRSMLLPTDPILSVNPDSIVTRYRTVYVQRDSVHGDTIDRYLALDCPPTVDSNFRAEPQQEDGPHLPAHFPSLWDVAGAIATNFRPQEPKQLVEFYAGIDHDLLVGGYGADVSAQVNLDYLRLINAQPYLRFRLQSHQKPEAALGVRGKLWGFW